MAVNYVTPGEAARYVELANKLSGGPQRIGFLIRSVLSKCERDELRWLGHRAFVNDQVPGW